MPDEVSFASSSGFDSNEYAYETDSLSQGFDDAEGLQDVAFDYNVESSVTTNSTAALPGTPSPPKLRILSGLDLNALCRNSVSPSIKRQTSVESQSASIKKQKVEAASPSVEGAPMQWTEQEILLLIECRLGMNEKFENPNTKKTQYWNIIAKDFEQHDYHEKINDLISK